MRQLAPATCPLISEHGCGAHAPRLPLRRSPRPLRRAPNTLGARRVPPARALFPRAPHATEPRLVDPTWPFGLAVASSVADLAAVIVAPALALPLYTLAVASCTTVVVLSLQDWNLGRVMNDQERACRWTCWSGWPRAFGGKR